ncbi:protein YgfX [Methylobacter psychrophilus]|uniref:protein YgfX n=1 Tax=Methylobacter psychrophilus TaxID=96941 RepID=UPI0021D4AD43|nr:protein YgfX [Methylobacter psychrophilus]
MHKEYNTTLLLALKPSRRFKKILVFIYVLALVSGIANALDFAIKINLCVLIGLHYWLTVWRLGTENYTIKYTEALAWELSKGEGFAAIEILKSTVITTQTLFLHFKYRSQPPSIKIANKKTLLILSDALAEEDYRYLIVKLKTTAIK